MDVKALINRVNQGKFSFAFALQLLAARDVESFSVPKRGNTKEGVPVDKS